MHTFARARARARAHAHAVSAGAMTVALGSLAVAPKVALGKPIKQGQQGLGSHAK